MHRYAGAWPNYISTCVARIFFRSQPKANQIQLSFVVIDKEIHTIHNNRFKVKAIIGNQNEIIVAVE
jgi:hypothetical protein